MIGKRLGRSVSNGYLGCEVPMFWLRLSTRQERIATFYSAPTADNSPLKLRL